MNDKASVLLSWSGGKDSAMALLDLQRGGAWEVRGLLTTVTSDYGRVSMHGIRTDLLEAQARAVGLELDTVLIGRGASSEDYDRSMMRTLQGHLAKGVRRVAFGDLFLEDIRRYREERLSEVGMEGVFPLWGRSTAELARGFIAAGFRAVVCCLDPRALDPSFAGRPYDQAFIADLPAGVDPCGENGEFHTFVYGGPNFAFALPIGVGETVEREGFLFTDMVIAAGQGLRGPVT